MTATLSVIGLALLFAVFGALRTADRCESNCGSCTNGCRNAAATGDDHV